MFICPICQKESKNSLGVIHHIHKKHRIKNPKDVLFDAYPDLFRNCLFCNKKIKHYISDSQSRKCCNSDCFKSWRISRKQSQETINKRIQNTDQNKKEQKRQQTMLTKYGALYNASNPEETAKKISKYHLGRKHSKEHHEKVIQTKRKNGTLKHTLETKNKIRQNILKTVNSPDFDRSKFLNRKINDYKQGMYKGLYCRSSYEKKFVDFCEKYDIMVVPAEHNGFAVKYTSQDGKQKTYFPDFYLPDFDLVIEIKPLSMYDYGDNSIKFLEAKKKFRFEVLTEEEFILDEKNWNSLYEHLCLV
jgi:hypothetical protein